MVKNSIIYTIGNLLPKIIVFFMLPIYMMYLTPSEYGMVQTINAIVSVLAIFYLSSLRTSVTRSYIDYDSDEDTRGFILTIFSFLVLFAIVLSIFLLVIKDLLGGIIFNNIPIDPFYNYLVILAFLSIFSTLPLTILRIREKPIAFISFNIIETVLIVSITLYMLIIQDMGATGAVQAIIYARIIMAVFYTIYIIIFTKLEIWSMKYAYIISSLALAIPLIPHFLASWVNNAGDRILVEQLSNLEALGIYSLGAQFNVALMMLVTSFNMAYAPRFYKMMKNGTLTQKFYDNLFNFSTLLILCISLLGLLLTPLFIQYFGDESYEADYHFMWFLFGGTIWHLGYVLSVTPIIYYKKMKYVSIISTLNAIMNIILNLILIPLIGILGAAIATYTAYFTQFVLVKRISTNTIKYNGSDLFLSGKILYFSHLILILNLIIYLWLETIVLIIVTIVLLSIILLKMYQEQKKPSLGR